MILGMMVFVLMRDSFQSHTSRSDEIISSSSSSSSSLSKRSLLFPKSGLLSELRDDSKLWSEEEESTTEDLISSLNFENHQQREPIDLNHKNLIINSQTNEKLLPNHAFQRKRSFLSFVNSLDEDVFFFVFLVVVVKEGKTEMR